MTKQIFPSPITGATFAEGGSVRVKDTCRGRGSYSGLLARSNER
jgi:hypothetical protein